MRLTVALNQATMRGRVTHSPTIAMKDRKRGTSVGNCAYLGRSRGIGKWKSPVGFMKRKVARGVASTCFLAVCSSVPMASQQRPASPQAPTIRVQSSLVLVDVISQDHKSGLPVRDFKKEDFRLFDNRHEVRIATFDAGARYDTRLSLFGLS